MSKYFEEMLELKLSRCDECLGTGKCDDAGPGDTSFNEWTCKVCKGTGKRPINEEESEESKTA